MAHDYIFVSEVCMNRIITIGREFGSGGREIGRRLSDRLGFAYYDQEIITEISKRTKLSEEYVRQVSERRPVASFPIHTGISFFSAPDAVFQQSMTVFSEQHKLLKELADKSDCIIVGRCADYILRDDNPFSIFVYADEASKLARCMSRKSPEENFSERDMKRKMAEIDRARAGYYSFFSNKKWGDKASYDLMVNTTNRDIKLLSAALADYVKSVIE